MNKINYDAEMQKIIETNRKDGKKPKLLLHSCCAPCFSGCIERLKDFFEITVYYYNPNLDTDEEFIKRQNEQIRLCKQLGIEVIVTKHDKEAFLDTVVGFEKEPEGGARCRKCIYLRLYKTALLSIEKNFDFFATTLTVSPLKNSQMINETGKEIEKSTGAKYLPADFKKKGGYLRSIQLSRQYDLYRQNYCGCEFSKK